jgi:hypothetical protein
VKTLAPPTPHPPRCHACGYDTTAIAPGSNRCPECGVELSAWRSRWHTRLTLHGLTLIIVGAAACAGVWMLNLAVRSWFSVATAQNADSLAPVRPTEALIFIPAVLTLSGIALLAFSSADNLTARRFGLVISALTAAVLCVMIAQRALAGSGTYDGPVWMRLVTIRNAGWWACATLVPLCAGATLSLLAGVARSSGLAPLAWWCARAALWLPLAALLAIATTELYQYLAQSALVAAQPQPVRTGPVLGRNGQFQFPPPPAPFTPATWYSSTAVQFARVMLYTFLIAAGTAVWLATCFIRLRLRDATDPNR